MYSLESLWIEQVRTNRDSPALDKLVKKYHPMIDNLAKHYYIVGFDREDWYQEAFITCYETCQIFDGTSGSRFGSFFKMKFERRVIDLIRRENASKRKINGMTEPLEVHPNQQPIDGHRYLIEVKDQVEILTKSMSKLELTAMQFILGKITMEQACKKESCTPKKIQNAIYRLKYLILKRDDTDLS
ncbi:sigma-70 family RNA polymerase sigma factor [Companilactobacillus formosensis]|jgi:RNA polymerase sporulation-specific sigma factor|uniref:sigma-70 family RNA polymerase sigma factor n=1 Tax=Companilactobacillus formosensis TaxID=1617889 RepID=UPI000E65004F|nr:sigma-70 family RNA polymerase sigma factor [Companilactobacillus formosensis]